MNLEHWYNPFGDVWFPVQLYRVDGERWTLIKRMADARIIYAEGD